VYLLSDIDCTDDPYPYFGHGVILCFGRFMCCYVIYALDVIVRLLCFLLQVAKSSERCYLYLVINSGWAELNFENLDNSTSQSASAATAGRHSIGSMPLVSSASSSGLLSRRLSRSTLPYSVRLDYFRVLLLLVLFGIFLRSSYRQRTCHQQVVSSNFWPCTVG